MGGTKEIRHIPLLWLLSGLSIIHFSCEQKTKPATAAQKDTIIAPAAIVTGDSTPSAGPDTSVLGRQAAALLKQLKSTSDYAAMHGTDSLIDMNGDGYKDLLIEFYGASGTGFKNMAAIHLYDHSKGRLSTTAIDFPNPTFYPDRKQVAGYYIGMGGGFAFTLRWKGMLLDTIEYIDITIQSKDDRLVCSSETRNKASGNVTLTRNNKVDLPDVYHYARYMPLISHKGRRSDID